MQDIRRFPFFFFNDTATTEIYTLSLHDALPISQHDHAAQLHHQHHDSAAGRYPYGHPEPHGGHHGPQPGGRSEEHTSELQSRQYLVCRLLLEKKNSRQAKTSYSSFGITQNKYRF